MPFRNPPKDSVRLDHLLDHSLRRFMIWTYPDLDTNLVNDDTSDHTDMLTIIYRSPTVGEAPSSHLLASVAATRNLAMRLLRH